MAFSKFDVVIDISATDLVVTIEDILTFPPIDARFLPRKGVRKLL
jgi:hypothetical protein